MTIRRTRSYCLAARGRRARVLFRWRAVGGVNLV